MNHFTVTINFCHCPDPADDVNYYIVVEADGKTYSSQKREGDNWQFIVNGAHNVTFRAVCGDPPHAVSDTGHVLIDPDGYVFHVTKGLSLTAGISDTVQVTNTVRV